NTRSRPNTTRDKGSRTHRSPRASRLLTMRSAKCTVCLQSFFFGRYRAVPVLLALGCLGVSGTTRAGEWKLGASIGAGVTLTDNVFLAPPGQQETDLV